MGQVSKSPNVQGEPIIVNKQDLPLSCPLPSEEVWDQHPRVFLTPDENGEAVCPYCGKRYLVK